MGERIDPISDGRLPGMIKEFAFTAFLSVVSPGALPPPRGILPEKAPALLRMGCRKELAAASWPGNEGNGSRLRDQ